MTHQYLINGMTCGSCVTKVKSALLKLGDVLSADIQRDAPQATITMQKHISTQTLQNAIGAAGPYAISEAEGHVMQAIDTPAEEQSWLQTYKPVLLVGAYVFGISLLAAWQSGGSFLMHWMRYFMAGFFIAFSFFKMLNLRAFADAYGTYDVVAARFNGWGYLYPFVELTLGILFLVNWNPVLLNAATFVVMSVSLVGVVRSVMNKRKIQCACLGTVFNLPMSTVTIIEDSLMVAMSVAMLILGL